MILSLHKKPITDFSIENTLHHRDRGSFPTWLDAFLRGPGNNIPLADGLLQEQRWWLGPELLPLKQLIPKCGPNCEYHEDDASWKRRTTEIAQAINNGTKLPPLIAEYRDGKLFLADGNHRHGALALIGETQYWTAIWFNSKEDLDRYRKDLSDFQVF
ncbi:MAG: hypothetical protein ACOX2O_08825 [Bdellovibrionota bacterium]|jgi:hypothetical protein